MKKKLYYKDIIDLNNRYWSYINEDKRHDIDRIPIRYYTGDCLVCKEKIKFLVTSSLDIDKNSTFYLCFYCNDYVARYGTCNSKCDEYYKYIIHEQCLAAYKIAP